VAGHSIVSLHGADLRRLDTSGANLSERLRASIEESDLDADKLRPLSEKTLDSVDLSGIHLDEAKLSNVSLKRANLAHAELLNVDLTSADLTGANLSGANLWFATLEGACLRQTDLSKANLSQARLSNADLSDAIIVKEQLKQTLSFSGALLPQNLALDTELLGPSVGPANPHSQST
jgi:uncharacterized protein YjbI with pentapeptide repeats